MSFWKSLFGGGSSGGKDAARTVRAIDHKGYHIEAQPYPEGGQYQVAGLISKELEGVVRSHRFVRADRFATLEEAADFAVMKGQQIVDQQGDRIFG